VSRLGGAAGEVTRAAVAGQSRFALTSRMIAGHTQRSRIRQTARGAHDVPIGMDIGFADLDYIAAHGGYSRVQEDAALRYRHSDGRIGLYTYTSLPGNSNALS
jgi:hypothetical protein